MELQYNALIASIVWSQWMHCPLALAYVHTLLVFVTLEGEGYAVVLYFWSACWPLAIREPFSWSTFFHQVCSASHCSEECQSMGRCWLEECSVTADVFSWRPWPVILLDAFKFHQTWVDLFRSSIMHVWVIKFYFFCIRLSQLRTWNTSRLDSVDGACGWRRNKEKQNNQLES